MHLAQEWVDRFHMKAVDYEYKECDKSLTEQFINDINNKVIIEKIIRELTALKDTSEVSGDQVLM